MPFFAQNSIAQELDLLGGIEDDSYLHAPVTNEFKTTQVINLPSLMLTAPGEFDFKINHRFNPLNSGAYEAFGF